MPFGAQVLEKEIGGGVRFRLWAPDCQRVDLCLAGGEADGVDGEEMLAMDPQGGGWFELTVSGAAAGTRYRFEIMGRASEEARTAERAIKGHGTIRVPDPASRFKPEDVHGQRGDRPGGLSLARSGWRGRPWDEAVVYELHVGTFTPEGTFRAAIDKLDHLVELGVTAIEIMPVADFPGRRNWGYDGVLPYAPDAAYGRPEDLKALVDAAHERGLMVLLDVVYNHFGPEGNYLHRSAPDLLHRPAPHALGRGDQLRRRGRRAGARYFIHNALYWIEEFHLDGLRLDAVHAILDDSPTSSGELAERVRAGLDPGRHVHLVLENEENQASGWRATTSGRATLVHGAMERRRPSCSACRRDGREGGLLCRLSADTEQLGRALAEGFAFQGEVMPYRGSTSAASRARSCRRPPSSLPPEPRPGRQPRLRRAH